MNSEFEARSFYSVSQNWMSLFRPYWPKTQLGQGVKANTFPKRTVSNFTKIIFQLKTKTKKLFTGIFWASSNIDRLQFLRKSQKQTQWHWAWKTCFARKIWKSWGQTFDKDGKTNRCYNIFEFHKHQAQIFCSKMHTVTEEIKEK